MRTWTFGALVALGALIFPYTSSSSRTATCGAGFATVPSASLGHSYSGLVSVDADSASPAWAVGIWRAGGANSPDKALFERWNGTSWVAIQGKNVGSGDNDLSDVAVVSRKSVWAVGSSWKGTIPSALVEHWTGAGVKVVKTPPLPASVLTGTAALSAKNIWAVGSWNLTGASRPLIEHWNGKKWKLVTPPGPPVSSLREIDALSASNIWAVGATSKANGVAKTLIEHWNGKSWKVVPSPSRGTSSNFLTGIEVIAANDAWAVGYIQGPGGSFTNLIEHWNGSAWTIVGAPAGGAFQNFLESVDAVSANDVWAVGNSAMTSEPPYGYRTMVLHWDGSSWKLVPSPSPSPNSGYNTLGGVAALESGLVWAVGDYNSGSQFDPLVIQRCD